MGDKLKAALHWILHARLPEQRATEPTPEDRGKVYTGDGLKFVPTPSAVALLALAEEWERIARSKFVSALPVCPVA